MKNFIYVIGIIFLLCSCQKSQEDLIEQEIPSLKEVFKEDFSIGGAIEDYQLDDPYYREVLKKHFNSITCENVMKAEIIHPEENKYDFKRADKIVKFAKKNNIKLRGHTLVWHYQVPDWFFKDNGKTVSKEKLKKRLEKHITKIMKRYKGKVYAWDVVNEVLDHNNEDGFRRSPWYEILGEEYIELAFKYARKADPDAKLILNDLQTTNGSKRALMVKYIKQLQEKGIPIDGVGMQMHVDLKRPSLEDFEKSLEEFSKLGIEIHITELDITVYDSRKQSYTYVTPEILNEQGHRVKELFEIINKYKDNITNVTFWGISDEHTWLTFFYGDKNDWPLPFNSKMMAKPFYWAMVDPGKLAPKIYSAKAIKGEAKIDGKVEEIWDFADEFPNLTTENDLQVKIKSLWSEEYLYFLITASGINQAEDNKITIYLDENNDKAEKIDDNDSIIEFDLKNLNNNNNNSYLKFSGNSFIFETKIPLKTIKPEISQTIGFDAAVTSGSEKQLRWNDKNNIIGQNSKNWGKLSFLMAPKGSIAYYGTPNIDGIKDDEYSKSNPLITDVFTEGTDEEESKFSGATGKCWTLWDENAIYVYAEVKDKVLSDANSKVYMQDSIEIFIDENNNKTGNYEQDDGQFRINFKNVASFGSTGSVEGFKSAAKIIDGGYAVELIIPYRFLTAEENTMIGFDFQVNDDQGSGKRDSIAKWNDPTNESWQSTAGYGVLKLIK